jgi:Fe-S-cluster containining protein
MTDNYIPATGEKLKFQCTQCGDCCRNHIITVTIHKAVEIAEKTKRSLNNIIFNFKEDIGADDHCYMSMRRKITDTGIECLFLKNNLCTLHTLEPGLKPENCKHVPYNLITEEDTGKWSDEKKDECRYKAKVYDLDKTVFLSVLESCPGIGKGKEINKETLQTEMAKDEENLLKTSVAIKERLIPVTTKDQEMVQWGKAILTGKGKFVEGDFSFIINPVEYADKIDSKKIADCIKKGIDKKLVKEDSVFRFSILDGEEKGMLLGLYGKNSEKKIKEKVSEKGQMHQHGFYDITNSECSCLV